MHNRFLIRLRAVGLCYTANGVAEQLQKNAEHSSGDTARGAPICLQISRPRDGVPRAARPAQGH